MRLSVLEVPIAIGLAVVSIIALLYLGGTLSNSLNDAKVSEVWNNTVNFFTNFTSKLGDAGTVLGVVLIIGLFAFVGLWGARKLGYA